MKKLRNIIGVILFVVVAGIMGIYIYNTELIGFDKNEFSFKCEDAYSQEQIQVKLNKISDTNIIMHIKYPKLDEERYFEKGNYIYELINIGVSTPSERKDYKTSEYTCDWEWFSDYDKLNYKAIVYRYDKGIIYSIENKGQKYNNDGKRIEYDERIDLLLTLNVAKKLSKFASTGLSK